MYRDDYGGLEKILEICVFTVILQFIIVLSSYFIHVFLLVFCLSVNIGFGLKGWFDVLICC